MNQKPKKSSVASPESFVEEEEEESGEKPLLDESPFVVPEEPPVAVSVVSPTLHIGEPKEFAVSAVELEPSVSRSRDRPHFAARGCPTKPVRCFIAPATSRPWIQTADISRSMFARKMSNCTRCSSGIAPIPDGRLQSFCGANSF
jgi:hypothetical protein